MYYKNLTVFLAILLEIRGIRLNSHGKMVTPPPYLTPLEYVYLQCTAILGSTDSEDRSIFAKETNNRVRSGSV